MAQPYPLEIKAKALAALAAGDSLRHVARTYSVSKGSLIRWRDAAGLAPIGPGLTQKRDEIGRQLLDLTTKSIDTLGFLLDQCRDPSWFQKQPAGEIATLLGVVSDKTIRLLAAMRPPDDTAPEQ